MVGLIPELTLEDLDLASKTKISKDPPDPVDPRDLTFADSFLDFESIEDWFKDIPNPDMAETGEVKVEVVEEGFIREANGCEGQIFNVYDPIDCGSEPTVDGSVPIDCGFVEKVECEISEHLSCSIEEELGKVSLLGGCDQNSVLDGGNCMRSERHEKSSALNGENGMQSEIVSRNAGEREPQNNENGNESLKSKIEGENGARSEIVSESSESSSSSSSSSSSDDDSSDDGDDMDEEENEKGKMKVEVEECDEAGEIEEGPIRSKNELEVLPPIPPVNVTLEPHHQMMPVGVVLSILGTQAIVEGVQKHNPLNEGSILWITESRSPLGLIDEIFGPVIHPYYVVRYNSESEIPAGIQAGTSSLSFRSLQIMCSITRMFTKRVMMHLVKMMRGVR
ncbi:H/ACA ribonucleoprotein complex non-core subunit NAF1 [Prunus yedoensis var. nudiflora]|uniref:H/ACA ribonucleoprotein complex non-core subunit NAF1 n=1 Tax=Prunus yedoensis var. nudiflora TaxID=2094558 RepID=A0A314UP15_PRUYE|nr:H/ACA ribonucleoprotein complex non-core subunit NAF1 [Prunus yedoensis var. nudiflora]